MSKKEPEIVMYFHCKSCINDKPPEISPEKWSRVNVGWTEKGFQVWCLRCEKTVVNVDFMGQIVIPFPLLKIM